MNSQNNKNSERDRLLHLLNLDDPDHNSILSNYEQRRDTYRDQMERAPNIRERIKFQNMMIALDDAFLEYQSSLRN